MKKLSLIAIAMALVANVAMAGGESPVASALRAAGATAEETTRGLKGALANHDQSAIAVVVPRPKQSLVLVLLRQADGSFNAVDVSLVEGGNFGKLGFPRTHYDRFETQAVEWLPRTDGWFQIVFRTRAWKSGQRYTTSEPLAIDSAGTPQWR